MAGRGVRFAITAEQAQALMTAASDDAIRELVEDIEEAWDRENLAESDKARDAMHRSTSEPRRDFHD